MLKLLYAGHRRSLRRSISTDCQAVRLRRFALVGQQLLDVSPRGALLACDEEVLLGDSLVVTFRIPNGGPYIDAHAEVSRIIGGWRRGDRGYCAGIRFVEMDRDCRKDLLVHLAGVPPPVPARRRIPDYAGTVRRVFQAA